MIRPSLFAGEREASGSMKRQADTGQDAGAPVTIKKYANRRLYNTESSSYITLDHLAQMTRAGRDFRVVDAKTDDDITHNVLTQIIMEEEGRGQTLLPVSFLRQLIALYGDSMQAVVPGYLEASMESFRRNQEQFRSAVEGAFANSPFAEIAKRNMAMLDAAAQAFKPRPQQQTSPDSGKDDEIAALRAELKALQDKVERLGN
jgi:polyhydroxyalkanoate synthesis repressor PhaR